MDTPANLEVLLDVPVKLTVELGSCQMSMRDVLQLNSGSIVNLDKLAEAPVDLFVNQKKIAHGEVVVIEDRLGIKITQLIGASGIGAAAPPSSDRSANAERGGVQTASAAGVLQP